MINPTLFLKFKFATAWVLLFAGVLPAWGLGKPEWAKPFLDAPSPVGPYIAKADEWVVVYGEVEFAISAGDRIEKRVRLILENRREKEIDFTATLAFDDLQTELSDITLNAERSIWHTINLHRSAIEVKEKGGGLRLVFTGAETIPARHRVVFEYTLRDKIGFFDWETELVTWKWPVAQVRYFVSRESVQKGMKLRFVTPGGRPLPEWCESQGDGDWRLTSIPAIERIPDNLAFQPSADQLYPYFVCLLPGSIEGGWDSFANRYAGMWKAMLAKIESTAVRERAVALTQGLNGPGEKATALARFVQGDIRNDDSNERGIQAWMPLTAEESLRSMKADCKGKVMLLQALLGAVDIASEPILCRIERDYFKWGQHPGEAVLNHVIIAVSVPQGSEPPGASLKEGPLKGWVIFDPTRKANRFGDPPGGIEGLPALAPLSSGSRFTLKTIDPAACIAEVDAECEYLSTSGMLFKISERDNGGEALGARLVSVSSQDDMLKILRTEFGSIASQSQFTEISVHRPATGNSKLAGVDFSGVAPKAFQEISNTALLMSPFALAAKSAGIPGEIPPVPVIPDEKKVELAPPWDALLNSQGIAIEVKLTVKLSLPTSWTWEPPKPRVVDEPWLKCTLSWELGSNGAWRGILKMSIPRGSWPSAERKERLNSVAEMYRAIYAPLVLKK